MSAKLKRSRPLIIQKPIKHPGNCLACEWYVEEHCRHAEKSFATLTNPICLQKVISMQLSEVITTLQEQGFDDE
jgi:hypothetical protein